MRCARTQYVIWFKPFRMERTTNPVNVLGGRAIASVTQYLYWVNANSSNPVHVLDQAKSPKNAYPPTPPQYLDRNAYDAERQRIPQDLVSVLSPGSFLGGA